MQKLIDAGLFELKPELGDESKLSECADRVVYFRELSEAPLDTPIATQIDTGRAITIVGACFGVYWDFP